MSYPTEQRYKILQQRIDDSESITSPPQRQKPFCFPGKIVAYLSRSDAGSCLQVIPLAPISVTPQGELTFTDGTDTLPDNATKMYYCKVFPIDVKPVDVEGSYSIGQEIMVFPYMGPESSGVKASYVCLEGGSKAPIGQYQGQVADLNVTDNQTGASFIFFHESIE